MSNTLTAEFSLETAFLDVLKSLTDWKIREWDNSVHEKAVSEKGAATYKTSNVDATYLVFGGKFADELNFDVGRKISHPMVVATVRGTAPSVKGYVGIADVMRVLRIVEKMEAKPKIRAKAAQIAASSQETDAAAAFWPDEGLCHPPLKNIRRMRVRLNQIGPLPPRIAFDPDRE